MEEQTGQAIFNAHLFDQILFDEYQFAFGLPPTRKQDIEVQQQRVTLKGDKIGDLIIQVATQTIKNRDKVDAEVNKLTTMDSYRHSLYEINLSRDEIFNCGIERTELEFSRGYPYQPYNDYEKSNQHLAPDQIKKNYIKNVLFQEFYNYCKREIPNLDTSDIYRFFIRMLCLCSGFVIPTLITGLTQQTDNPILIAATATTATATTSFSCST